MSAGSIIEESLVSSTFRIGSSSAGFTIIEAVAALGIFALGMMALASLQITAVKVNAAASKMTRATHAGQNAMERLMALPYDHSDLEASEEAHQLLESTPGYSVKWRVSEAESSKTIRVTVAWNSGIGEVSCELETQKINF